MSLLLASASPRRAELLSQLGVEFRQAPVEIDETPFANEAAVDYVERMAHEKALSALDLYGCKHGEDQVILAADTTVVLGKRILGKPENFDNFSDMMQTLSGQKHQVFTAITIVKKNEDQVFENSVISENSVQFAILDKDDISWYWQTGEPQDKAGGYGLQGRGARFVRSINGSYSGIVGLPLYETAEILKNFGILPSNPLIEP